MCVKGRASFSLAQFALGHMFVLLLCFVSFPTMVFSPTPFEAPQAVTGQWEGFAVWRDGGAAPYRTGSMVLSRPGLVLFGQLLLDVEQELVVGEGRFGAVLDEVLEETALCRRVVSEQRE